ncbi:unnamed protein product [Urochloa decumbens]|uniref:Protein JASON-like n=1 Tax=Urochloa decumbens TaxID=240449 RepID=A0ABC8YIB6_9POAL
MMGCLFGCFRASGDGGEVKGGGGQLVPPPSLAPATSHKDAAGRRTRPPSRNALSAVFQREDEGSRAEQTASSWADQKKGMDHELVPQVIIQESCGALLETTNETQTAPQNVHLMEALKVENCETPRSHQSSTVPDAMSSSKTNDELQSSATSLANNVEELTNENNTEACAQDEEQQALDPAKDFEECGVSKKDFLQPEQSAEDPNCAKNDNVVAMEISISDEYFLSQSSEGSISSSNKIRDSLNTPSMEQSLETEATIHATGKKVLKNNDSELELPSLAHWLKPPNPKKPFRDESLTGDRSHSAKGSDEDRPIIGMVAAHWKDQEPANLTPKWFDGNGIPNSTNKYKEDQKVSWHATPFEERLEKALSEEKLLSERNCSSGKTSQFLGVEGEESDTAESSRLYAAAYA